MRKRILRIMISVLAVLSLVFLGWTGKYWIGVSKNNIESNAKLFQGISENWKTKQETTDIMSAMLFYPDNQTDFVYSIYLNKPWPSIGYFFRIGGTISEIEDGILAVSFEGYNDIAYLSMNKANVNYLCVYDGSNLETIEIDATTPFVVILPNTAGNVTFLNADGNTVDFICRDFSK